MTLKTTIRDGHEGTSNLAGVTSIGELLVRGFGTVQTSFVTINSILTGFNLFLPKPSQVFIITGIILDMTAAAGVTIYEASSATTLTVDKTIFTASLIKNSFQAIMLPFGSFIPVTLGEFLNAKADAQPLNVTAIGYYIPA